MEWDATKRLKPAKCKYCGQWGYTDGYGIATCPMCDREQERIAEGDYVSQKSASTHPNYHRNF